MSNLQRPLTFQEGNEYSLCIHYPGSSLPAFVRVTFLAYDPCPAIVIVRNKDKRVRCCREDLYILAVNV